MPRAYTEFSQSNLSLLRLMGLFLYHTVLLIIGVTFSSPNKIMTCTLCLFLWIHSPHCYSHREGERKKIKLGPQSRSLLSEHHQSWLKINSYNNRYSDNKDYSGLQLLSARQCVGWTEEGSKYVPCFIILMEDVICSMEEWFSLSLTVKALVQS